MWCGWRRWCLQSNTFWNVFFFFVVNWIIARTTYDDIRECESISRWRRGTRGAGVTAITAQFSKSKVCERPIKSIQAQSQRRLAVKLKITADVRNWHPHGAWAYFLHRRQLKQTRLYPLLLVFLIQQYYLILLYYYRANDAGGGLGGLIINTM